MVNCAVGVCLTVLPMVCIVFIKDVSNTEDGQVAREGGGADGWSTRCFFQILI